MNQQSKVRCYVVGSRYDRREWGGLKTVGGVMLVLSQLEAGAGFDPAFFAQGV